MRLLVVFCTLILVPLASSSQVDEHSGWFTVVNNMRINKRWSLHFDAHVRTTDEWQYLRNLVLRKGLIYRFNQNNTFTQGYVLVSTYHQGGAVGKTLTEHQIWQQFVHARRFSGLNGVSRLRLEHRFMERLTENIFSQRLRVMMRAVVPLARHNSTFQRGLFLGMQDEVFLNLCNKQMLNGSLYDQNRIYIALGYRFNRMLDMDFGYLNQSTNGRMVNVSNHALQMIVYTRF